MRAALHSLPRHSYVLHRIGCLSTFYSFFDNISHLLGSKTVYQFYILALFRTFGQLLKSKQQCCINAIKRNRIFIHKQTLLLPLKHIILLFLFFWPLIGKEGWDAW